MPEDAEIIELYWARNENAIIQSERKYGGFCMSIAANILPCRQDADECVLDTWHRSWLAMPPERPASLRAFFGRIVRNISISRYRREHAQKRFSGMTALFCELEDCVPSPQSTEQAAETVELTRTIDAWLMRLSVEDRVLFVRRYWYGDALNSLARACGVSANALSQRMYRLRQSLRDTLIGEGISI